MSRYIDADNLHNAKFQNTSGYDFGSAYRCGWNDAIDAICENEPTIDAVSEWIPCSERLPTLSEDGTSEAVLLCWSDGQVTVGAYQGNRTFCGQVWPEAKDCRVTVVAWMPLPPAWKGADDE